MKILTVNTYDINGGAARGAYRLHKALLSNGIASTMLVNFKESDDYTVIRYPKRYGYFFNKVRALLDSLPVKLYKNRTSTLFSPACIPNKKLIKKIVRFHKVVPFRLVYLYTSNIIFFV